MKKILLIVVIILVLGLVGCETQAIDSQSYTSIYEDNKDLSIEDFSFYLKGDLTKKIENKEDFSLAYISTAENKLFETARKISVENTRDDIEVAYDGLDYKIETTRGSGSFYDLVYECEYGKLIFKLRDNKVDNIEIKSKAFEPIENKILEVNEAFKKVNIRYYDEVKFMICIDMNVNLINTNEFPTLAPEIINSVKTILRSYNIYDYQYYISVVDDSDEYVLYCAWPAGDDHARYRIQYYENGKRIDGRTELYEFETQMLIESSPTPQPTLTPANSVNETVSQRNAVRKAKEYLSFTAFSRDGLVSQLVYEQFSKADAIYGADNSDADWDEQAAKKAQEYLNFMSFSRKGLIDQLIHDKFTREQATYGVNAVGL